MKWFYVCIGILLIGGLFYVEGWAQDSDKMASREAEALNNNQQDLRAMVASVNELYRQEKSDLELAVNLIEKTMAQKATQFYAIADRFYLYSLVNGRLAQEKDIINRELERVMPLVGDSVQKSWQNLLKEKDPKLMAELAGFWEVNDPYPSTPLNERLLQHWARIAYAKEHFTEADNSPYGTDDRGTYYVRLGPPVKKEIRPISLSDVQNPDPFALESFRFQPSSGTESELELWVYNLDNGEKPFFMFGKRNGRGEYGLRKSTFELINMDGVRLLNNNDYNTVPPPVRDRFFEGLAKLDVMNELSSYHSYFSYAEFQIENRIINAPGGIFKTLSDFEAIIEANDRAAVQKQIRNAPSQKTVLTADETDYNVNKEIYRFLNENNRPEYLVALHSLPTVKEKFLPYYFIKNSVIVYSENWKKLLNTEDVVKFETKDSHLTSLYMLADNARGHHLFYASELINTAYEQTYSPDRITKEAARIEAATGKQAFNLPSGLPTDQSLLISDVILGNRYTENEKARIPVIPNIDNQFTAGSELTIYFEAYSVPEGGYSFTYFFKKDRWLLGHKKIERTEITVLADKVKERDSQLFTIDINDLEPGSYEFVLEFSPLNDLTDSGSRQKKIEIEIVE